MHTASPPSDYDPRMPRSPAPAVVSVQQVTPEIAAAVRALRADPAQYAFVGDVASNLIDTEADPDSEAMAVLADGKVVGFYRLDLRPGAVAGCDYGNACAALRSLLIDRSWQGRGLGTRALNACYEDLERRHPRVRLLALTVHCDNQIALQAYRNAGFIDSGRMYFGERSGPQHVLLRTLGSDDVGKSAA